MSPELFAWLRLTNQVTVDCLGLEDINTSGDTQCFSQFRNGFRTGLVLGKAPCEVRMPTKALDEPIFKYMYIHELLNNSRNNKLSHFQIRPLWKYHDSESELCLQVGPASSANRSLGVATPTRAKPTRLRFGGS